MVNYTEKEVYFDVYCRQCKNNAKEENMDPCWDCLDRPTNTYSHKPVYFDPKDDTSNPKSGK